MNYAGRKISEFAWMLALTQIPFSEIKPTRQAHRYPVQYVFAIDEQSFETYLGIGFGIYFFIYYCLLI